MSLMEQSCCCARFTVTCFRHRPLEKGKASRLESRLALNLAVQPGPLLLVTAMPPMAGLVANSCPAGFAQVQAGLTVVQGGFAWRQKRCHALQKSWFSDLRLDWLDDFPLNVAIRIDSDPDLVMFHSSPGRQGDSIRNDRSCP